MATLIGAWMPRSAGAQSWDDVHAKRLLMPSNGTDLTHTLTIQVPTFSTTPIITLPGATLTFPATNATGLLSNDGLGNLLWGLLSTASISPGANNTFLVTNGSGTVAWLGINIDGTLTGNGIGSTLGFNLSHANTWTGAQTFAPTTDVTGVLVKGTSAGSPASDILDVTSSGGSNYLKVDKNGLTTIGNGLTVASGATSLTSGGLTNAGAISGATTISGNAAFTSGDATHRGSFVMYDASHNHTLTFQTASTVATGTYTWPTAAAGALWSDGSGNISIGTLSEVNGGTNQSSYAAGDILYASDINTLNRLPIAGLNGQILTASSGFPAWAAVDLTNPNSVSGQLPPANGGTGFDGSSAANGKLPIGNGAGFTLATLTAGPTGPVSITNGSGSITLNLPQNLTTASSPTFAGATLNGDLSFGGNTARSVLILQQGVAASPGSDLTMQAGTAGANADLNGGNLNIASGTARGNGSSSINFQTVKSGQGSNTNPRTPVTVATLDGTGTLQFANGATRAINIASAAAATNGNDLDVTAGAGTGAGNKNGGNLVLAGGAKANSGTDGAVNISTTTTGNTSIGNSTGTITLTSSGLTLGSVTSGTWNGTAIDVTHGGTGANLSATGGASQVLKQTSIGGAVTVAQLANTDITGFGTMSTQNASGVTITGGTINGTSVGATTASTGAFTTITGTSSLTLGSDATPTAGTIVLNDNHSADSRTETIQTKATLGGSWTVTLPDATGNLAIIAGTNGAIANTDVSGLGTMSTQAASGVVITGGTGAFTGSGASVPLSSSNTGTASGGSFSASESGVQSASTTAVTVSETSTNATVNATKKGLSIASTGTWTGAGAGVNDGLTFNISGGTTNNDIIGTGSTWSITSAGAATLTSITGMTTPLTVGQGGTGSSSQNWVDLTTAQASIGGAKTFTSLLSGSAGLTITGGAVSLNASSNNTTSINTGTSTSAVHIADGSTGGNAITIGNANGATSIVEAVGTGNYSLDGVAGSTYAIGTSTTTGTITIGGTAQSTGAITLGSSSATNTVNVGSGSGATTVQIGNGTGGNTVTIGNGANASAQSVSIANGLSAANSTVSILSGVGTAGAGTLALGNNTRVTTIGLGNIDPAAARTLTIGSNSSGILSTINIGTGGTSVASGNTINIGTGATTAAGGNAIHIGDGTPTGSGTNLVTIGSTVGASSTTIQSGSVGVDINLNNNQPTNINTGTSSGAVSIGRGTGTVNIGNSAGVTLAAFNYGVDAGSTDSYAISLTPALTAYTTGMIVIFKANTVNTGAASLNINSLGAKTIVKRSATTLGNADIPAGGTAIVAYDGTNFILLNPVAQ